MRRWTLRLLLLAGLAFCAGPPLAAQGAPTRALAVAAIGMTVSDMDRSVEFYCRVLGFAPVSDVEVAGPEYETLTGVFGARIRIVKLRLGTEELELEQYLAPEGRPAPVDSRANDRWFQHIAIVVRDMDAAYRALRAARVRYASTGPQLLPASNPNAGGIRAFYFKDPDGHFLEAIWFPPGKGDPRWQQPADRLFLGIDHTAIVVRNTGRSLGFYRDMLGLRVAGESRNYGTEQEHLNNVEGASLRITGLRSARGPGVELLEYLTPQNGRDFPPDARPNDVIHWQVTLLIPPGEGLDLLAASGIPLLSRRVATLPEKQLGFSRGILVRDPDGHAIRIIQP
ncbi:MAG TPA: VOC family protein [Gemmatimonadales bacterium]|nr:VOC family protein [Gemmatimonadales bacterium]